MDTIVRAIVTLAALTLLSLRAAFIPPVLDGANAALLVIALLPWISALLENVGVPTGWKTEFRKLEEEQRKQKEELERLRLLTACHVTENEWTYLKQLASGQSLTVDHDAVPSFFKTELRRLIGSGLVEALPGKGIDTLLAEGGVAQKHLRVTEQGRGYVKLRERLESAVMIPEPTDPQSAEN